MDAIAYSKLEAALTSAKVPRALWPRYFESERYRLLRKRCRDDDEYRRRVARKLQDDAAERERRNAFSLFIVLLLWLLSEQQRDRQRAADFASLCVLVLANSDHARMAGDAAIHRGTACALIAAGFNDTEACDALSVAVPGGLGYAQHLIHTAEPLPEPQTETEAPATTSTEPEQQHEEPDTPEELTPAQQGLAAPAW